jgi:CheY-like chemotaxis protein
LASERQNAENLKLSVILIVEDEPFTRELAVICIDEWLHRTLVADDMGSALAIVRSGESMDALFTDINLKDARLGGCDLAREAIILHPDLRVLYTSGNEATDELRSLFVSRAHFLGKPYTPDQLRIGIDALLEA